MKKIFIISILAIGCVNNLYAAGGCGIGSLDPSTGSTSKGYTNLNDFPGDNESNYGLTTGSGQWAIEFSYGTVWGMAKCSETAGNNSSNTWPESSKSDWLKTPSDTTGGYCWCQATGFTASGNNYTSGPQCTTTASSSWVFLEAIGSFNYCARYCPQDCAGITYSAFRVALFGAVPADPTVSLNWYNNGTTISGASSCVVGGTFVPPTPPARTGYVFAGWKSHAGECGIWKLDTSIAGRGAAYMGYTRIDNNAVGSSESKYGLTLRSGEWATEFDYGTVWGMAKCSETSGNSSSYTWPESSKSDWLKTPSDTTGQYCWCQATGFTASGNSYTSGPQCTTNASSLWVFVFAGSDVAGCKYECPSKCAIASWYYESFRAGMFGSVGQ